MQYIPVPFLFRAGKHALFQDGMDLVHTGIGRDFYGTV